MNGCKRVDFDFTPGGLFDSNCELQSSDKSSYAVSYYTNLSKLEFNRSSSSSCSQVSGIVRICKYTLDKNLVGFVPINFQPGLNSIDLDSNYLYRVSYNRNCNQNVVGYQCNVGIGSMANELAFGKLTFLDQIGTIIPFVISLIAFALGFLLLKKMIKRGNQGHA